MSSISSLPDIVWQAFFFVLGISSCIALLSFNIHDPSWFYYSTKKTDITNLLGQWGAHLAAFLFYLLGNAAYLFPCLSLLSGYILYKKEGVQETDRLFMGVVSTIVFAGLCYIYRWGSVHYMVPGGIVGQELQVFLLRYVDKVIISSMLWFVLFASFFVLTRLSFMTTVQSIMKVVYTVYAQWRVWLLPLIKYAGLCLYYLTLPFKKALLLLISAVRASDVHDSAESLVSFEYGEIDDVLFSQNTTESDTDLSYQHQEVAFNQSASEQEGTHVSPPVADELIGQPKESIYKHIDVTAFGKAEANRYTKQEKDAQASSQTLEEKLLRFGITGHVVSIKPGPVVTLFEYEPESSIKVSRIVALEDDLALALEAVSVRIVAPIPGTSKVGFEVANKVRQAVYFQDIVQSKLFKTTDYHLPIILGKDTTGHDVLADLIDMPHLLVAGSTGSGKSVALNTLVMSLLCKLSPQELKFIIIDPKRLEFAAYKDIPHLLFPLITKPHKAAPVLQWLVKTMEDRYEMMAQVGARNIQDYKQMVKDQNLKDECPYIVLIIDELADLMMVARKEIEENIARLAQMARAAGIHLIVATQRPSVDVLTGVIKVNFPSRMSFRVTSKVDSRTVLDALGAETLLGKGDMLFVDAHSARMKRIHGAYVSDKQIATLVSHVKAQQKVEYMDLEETVAEYNQQADAEANDSLMPDVLEFLSTIDEVSISLLQRRFRIGYNRSARIIEMLEMQGKIMPSSGGKTRKVIH